MKYLATLITLLLICQCGYLLAQQQVDKPSSHLTDFTLGVAFPPSASKDQRQFSIEHMNQLTIRWLRINQDWKFREPKNNQFNWQPLEDRLLDYKAANKNIMLTIDMKGLPQWWLSLPTDSARILEFEQFCTALLAR